MLITTYFILQLYFKKDDIDSTVMFKISTCFVDALVDAFAKIFEADPKYGQENK